MVSETMNTMLYSSYQTSATNPRQFYAATSDQESFVLLRIKPGSLYCWFYNPKYRNKLPYYDRISSCIHFEHVSQWLSGNQSALSTSAPTAVLMTRLVDNMLRKSSSGDYLTFSTAR